VHALPDSEAAQFEWAGWEEDTRVVSFARGDALGAADTAIDVGPDSIELLAELVAGAGAVLVHGPLGVCELAEGAAATRELLHELELRQQEAGAHVVLVGGALAAAAARLGLGAGATVCESGAVLLCHRVVPGLAMLSEDERGARR